MVVPDSPNLSEDGHDARGERWRLLVIRLAVKTHLRK